MVTSFGIALREGIEAALVVGIVLLYLVKTGRSNLKGFVYAAIAAAAVISVALAVTFETAGFDADDPTFEGIILAIAGLFVITMVVWMMRTARGLKASMEGRLDSLTASRTGRALGWGLFGFVFIMILREGAELVLFLKAATLGTEASIANLGGALVGLGLAVLFAVFFVRGSVRVDVRRFLRYTSWALLLLGAKLLLGSLHELGELRILPFGNALFEEAGELTEGVAGDVVMSVVIAVPVALLLWDVSGPWRRRLSARVHGGRGPRRPTVDAAHDQH
ncbi:MAG: FTR1 family protein [Actinobacteria bacterium]|nr:FTR1 family protein [Actinomycetota bacterium]